MPAIVAIAIRYVIMAAIQLGIWSIAEKFIIPMLNKAIVEVAEAFGVDEDEAEAIVANEFIQYAESIGIFALTLRSKLPIKVAERLGFTTKGFSLRKLKPATQVKAGSAVGSSKIPVAATPEVIETTAKQISQARQVDVQSVSSFIKRIMPTGTNILISLALAANVLDFAAWPGSAFQNTFKSLFAILGLKADEPMPTSKVLSKDVWDKVYNTYRTAGVHSIKDPYK